MANSRRENQTLEMFSEAREIVLHPDCEPREVRRALEDAVEALERHDVDPTPIQQHLDKHEELTGDSGFPPDSRKDCLDTLRRVHRSLRDSFDVTATLDCVRCGSAIPTSADRDLCSECRQGGGDIETTDEGANTVEKTEISIQGTNINFNSDNSTNEYH